MPLASARSGLEPLAGKVWYNSGIVPDVLMRKLALKKSMQRQPITFPRTFRLHSLLHWIHVDVTDESESIFMNEAETTPIKVMIRLSIEPFLVIILTQKDYFSCLCFVPVAFLYPHYLKSFTGWPFVRKCWATVSCFLFLIKGKCNKVCWYMLSSVCLIQTVPSQRCHTPA